MALWHADDYPPVVIVVCLFFKTKRERGEGLQTSVSPRHAFFPRLKDSPLLPVAPTQLISVQHEAEIPFFLWLTPFLPPLSFCVVIFAVVSSYPVPSPPLDVVRRHP